MTDTKEIEILIRLLDDPDSSVFNAVKGKLSNIGSTAIPILETAWETSLDSLFQTRIENIIQEIHHDNIKKQFTQWVNEGATDLLMGASLITKFQYPDIDYDTLNSRIELIKKDIWLELNENLTALEKIKIMNHIFFDIHGFSRSSTFQNSAQVNFLNQVLDTKKGSPISLAILYASIAQKLDIPIYGVALPKNFILCYKDNMLPAFDSDFTNGVMFYVNPFNKGIVFGKKEIEQFIKQQNLENKPAYFQPCTNKDTIAQLLKTLIDFFESKSEETKANNYKSLLNILYF